MKKGLTIALAAIVLALGSYGLYIKNKDIIKSDAVKFSEEYTKISKENAFVYRNLGEANNIIENGTGIVYLGFPECQWCQKYVTYLNEVANDWELDKIYYCNILEDRKNNTDDYKKTVSLLEKYLNYDEEGNKRIYVPSVIAVYKGEIVGFDDESSLDTLGFDNPDNYWTEERVSALKERLDEMVNNANKNLCTECNE